MNRPAMSNIIQLVIFKSPIKQSWRPDSFTTEFYKIIILIRTSTNPTQILPKTLKQRKNLHTYCKRSALS
jgi:hypothetical protein